MFVCWGTHKIKIELIDLQIPFNLSARDIKLMCTSSTVELIAAVAVSSGTVER